MRFELTTASLATKGSTTELHPQIIMAERTRLELATLGVTGRYSNQLNYRSKMAGKVGIEPTTR